MHHSRSKRLLPTEWNCEPLELKYNCSCEKCNYDADNTIKNISMDNTLRIPSEVSIGPLVWELYRSVFVSQYFAYLWFGVCMSEEKYLSWTSNPIQKMIRSVSWLRSKRFPRRPQKPRAITSSVEQWPPASLHQRNGTIPIYKVSVTYIPQLLLHSLFTRIIKVSE